MTTRRRFLQSAALAAVPVGMAGQAPAPGGFAVAGRATLPAVVMDPASAASRGFAALFAAQGARVHEVRGADVTSLWREELAALWQRMPAPLAGLTPPSVLFCLEQLAIHHGLQVRFHAEHVIGRDGAVAHRELMNAGRALPVEGRIVEGRGPWWPTGFAARVAGQLHLPTCAATGLSCAGLLPDLAEDSTVLASWIIAPRVA